MILLGLSLSITQQKPAFAYASRKAQTFMVNSIPVNLELKATNGKVWIVRGPDHEVTVKTLIRADTLAKLDETSEKVQREGYQLSIIQIDHLRQSEKGSPYVTSYSPPLIDVKVTVPKNTNLKITTSNADIKVEGVAGLATVTSYNGSITYQATEVNKPFVMATTTLGKLQTAIPLVVSDTAKVHLKSYNGDVNVTETETPLELLGGLFFNGQRFVKENWFVMDGHLTRTKPKVPYRCIDLAEKYIVPAYGDAHTHHFEGEYFSRRMSELYLKEGTLFAQSMTNHISMKADANKIVNRSNGMDVAFSDAGLTATNAHPTLTYEILANPPPKTFTPEQTSNFLKGKHTQEGDAYWIVDTPEELEAVWPKFLASDPDLVKTFLVNTADREKNKDGLMGSFGVNPKMVPLIVKKAHAAGLPVYAHVDTAFDFQIALESGVDGLAHMPGYGLNEEPFALATICDHVAKMARSHFVQVTAGISEQYAGKNLARTRRLQFENLSKLRKYGAIPVIGSDSYGSTSAADVRAWLAIGETPLQVLNALSRDTPRSIFPGREIGFIKEGFEANLTVLDQNPLEYPDRMLGAELVYKLGRQVYCKSQGGGKISVRQKRELR